MNALHTYATIFGTTDRVAEGGPLICRLSEHEI